MIQSMTGFASQSFTLILDKEHKATISLNLKSLNGRYFEVNCRLPHPLSSLENDFIRLFKDELYRGSIYFTVHVDNPTIFKGTVEPAYEIIKGYIDSLKKIKKQFGFTEKISLHNLLDLSNIFVIEEKSLDEHLTAQILKATKSLINKVIEERNKEGKALLKDIEARIAIMEKEISIIEKRAMDVINDQKGKIQQTIKDLAGDESDFAQARKNALYLVLDKIDIHEETIRFKSHVQNLKKQLKSADIEKGKRLDFTLQELGRETNTIMAKCSDAQIAQHAINLKVEIEKVREQAQNIV